MSRVPLAARVCILTIALLLAALPAVSNAATDCPHKAGWRPNGAQLKLLREGHKSGFQEENLDLPEGTERGAFCNIDLKGETLNTANLSGYDLRGADFTGAALFAVDLSGADLAGAKLRGADLSSASLAGTDLRATILSDAKLHRADLNGANLDKVEIYGVDISGAKLIRASLREAHLIGADLSGSNLTDADLAGAKLDKTRLVGARLHRTKLRGVTLRQTVASGADFYKVDARGAVFTEAELDKAAMIEANLAGADFSGASLRGAQLIGATVAGGSFFWADLLGADLSGVDLTGVDLRGANLKDTKLFDARLDDADLRGADLSGATLTQMTLGGAKLADADLTGAVYQPDLAPAGGYLTGLRGLETVRFAPGKSGALVRLRALLREAGLRDLERAATFAIEGGITRHALTRGEKDVVAGIKGALRLVLFEWTTGYGFYPLRALRRRRRPRACPGGRLRRRHRQGRGRRYLPAVARRSHRRWRRSDPDTRCRRRTTARLGCSHVAPRALFQRVFGAAHRLARHRRRRLARPPAAARLRAARDGLGARRLRRPVADQPLPARAVARDLFRQALRVIRRIRA